MAVDNWYFEYGGGLREGKSAVRDAYLRATQDAMIGGQGATHVWFDEIAGLQAPSFGEWLTADDIARIKAAAFDAGKAYAAEKIAEEAVNAGKSYRKPTSPLPIHRAMANHNRIGEVFAHRPYWLNPNETD